MQTNSFLSKFIPNFYRRKSSHKTWATSLVLKNCPNSRPIGKNSPNLVTLFMIQVAVPPIGTYKCKSRYEKADECRHGGEA
jgi:hypothetical protein